MDWKYFTGLFFSALAAILTIEGIQYRRRRDEKKDKKSEQEEKKQEREAIDNKMLSLAKDTDSKLIGFKKEIKEDIEEKLIPYAKQLENQATQINENKRQVLLLQSSISDVEKNLLNAINSHNAQNIALIQKHDEDNRIYFIGKNEVIQRFSEVNSNLEKVDKKLDKINDNQLEEKEKEIQRLQNLLEKERG